jgi:hypothetical protein
MNDDLDLDLSLDAPLDAANIDDLSLIATDDDTDPITGLPKTPEQIALEKAARDKVDNDPATLRAEIASLKAAREKDAEIAALQAKLAVAEAVAAVPKSAPVAAAVKTYSAEERKQMNETLLAEISSDPLTVLQRVRDLAKADALAEMGAQANPALNAAGQTLIDNFLARQEKAMQPKWYAAAEKKFHAATKALDPAGLLTIDAGQRATILQRFWTSAIGEVTQEQLAAGKRTTPTNVARGGGGGGGGTQPTGLRKLAAALGCNEIDAQKWLKSSNLTLKEALEAVA